MYIAKIKRKKSDADKALTPRMAFFWLTLVASTMFTLNNIIYGYTAKNNNISAVLSVFLSLYVCYIYRKNVGLFLMNIFIAYTNYSIAAAVYLYPEVRPSGLYRQFTLTKTYGIAINSTLIFELVFILLSFRWVETPNLCNSKRRRPYTKAISNDFLALVCLLGYIAIFALFFRFGENGERAQTSAVLEYRILFFIIGSFYSGGKRQFKLAWVAIIGITTVLSLAGGNRADTFSSLIFLAFFWFSNILTSRRVTLMLPVAVMLFAAVGFLRANFSITSENIMQTASTLTEDKLAYEGAVFGYLPTLAMIELTPRLTAGAKLTLLKEHIIYAFTLGSAGDSNPDLSEFSHNYYAHYWGYISPSYFYVWCKYFSPVLFGLLTQMYNLFYTKTFGDFRDKYLCNLKKVLSFYYISTVTRWYCYGPMGLIRGMFVMAVLFTMFYFADAIMRKKFNF